MNNVNLTIRAGEVLGLFGENGAGKSTLMNVLCGLYRPDEGEILIDGKPVVSTAPAMRSTPASAWCISISCWCRSLRWPRTWCWASSRPVGSIISTSMPPEPRCNEISEKYGLEVDPDALIENLPVGVQQRVEIIKVLFRSADVLILDEPTAVLTPQEVEEFLRDRQIAARCRQGAGVHHPQAQRNPRDRRPDQRAARGEIVGEGDPEKLLDPADSPR
jgi:ABC-type sugar transport system ATPase subunit